jgi:hypothetical protein
MDNSQGSINVKGIRGRMAIAVFSAAVLLAAFLLSLGASSAARADTDQAFWAVCPQAPLNGCDYATIQGAVDAAGSGDIIRVVGHNTYVENVVITKSLTLLGGCVNAACAVRAPGIFVTTIDGAGADRVVTIEGEGNLITVTVDGFVITGGDASGDARHPHHGGGVGSWNANLALQHSVITDNVAARTTGGSGGGVYVESGSAAISHNHVVSNQASASLTGYGGGIALHQTSGQVSDNMIQDNTSSAATYGGGGGVSIQECNDLVVTGNTIHDNTAAASDAGYGGGVYVQYSTVLTLADNAIYANTGSASGVGEGGGLYMYKSQVVMSENRIRENLASRTSYGTGGGISVVVSDAVLEHNWVVSNTASLSSTAGMGGGLSFCSDVTATLSGDVVLSNTASSEGNGHGIDIGSHVLLTATNIVVAKNHASGSGGAIAIFTLSSTVTIVNSTVVSNTYKGILCSGSPTVTLVNLILWGNGDEMSGFGAAFLYLAYSDVEDADTGPGVIHQDPLFVDAANDDFRLQAGSPCIDAGADPTIYPWVPGEDWDGDPRPNGSGYDIGADEFWAYIYLPLVLREY